MVTNNRVIEVYKVTNKVEFIEVNKVTKELI